jgi:hypothetical protein
MGSYANRRPFNSNEANLDLIARMGVHAPRILQKNQPSKFKAVALMVRAVIRLRRLSIEWKEMQLVGESLQKAKAAKSTGSIQRERRQRTPLKDMEKKRLGRLREI